MKFGSSTALSSISATLKVKLFFWRGDLSDDLLAQFLDVLVLDDVSLISSSLWHSLQPGLHELNPNVTSGGSVCY